MSNERAHLFSSAWLDSLDARHGIGDGNYIYCVLAQSVWTWGIPE